MKYLPCALVLALLSGLCAGGAWAQTTHSGPATAAIPGLDVIVQDLGSADFVKREAAQKEMGKIPVDQYDALSQFAAGQADEEVKSRLHTRINEMVWELAQVQSNAPLRTAAHITGRLVDETGKPMASASASAYLAAWGELRPNAQRARTDAEGRFDLPVPFLGVHYDVFMEMPGWGTSNAKNIMAEKDTTAGDFVITRGSTKTIHGSVVDSAGKPVALQQVQIVGGYGITGSVSTDAQGRFTIDGLPSFLGQPVAIVHTGNQTTSLEIIRADDITLKLVEAGGLSGKVLGDKGQPLAGATVLAQPWFASGLQLQEKTAADGSYSITGVPPGDWLVTAETPAFSHRPPQEMYTKLPRITVKPGATATANIAMERMAVVYGRVLDQAGRVVSGAVVGTKATWQRENVDEWRLVQTDAQGRFIIGTGQTARPDRPAENQLIVFSAQEGLATVPLRDVSPGEVRELTVKLAGSMHVAGRIVDPAGKPIPGVDCGNNVRTDAYGRFDLGRVSRAAQGPTEVQFHAPRPPGKDGWMVSPNGTMDWGDAKPEFADRAHAPTFYANQKIPLPAAGDATDLKVTLQPAQPLEFTGIVRDAQGRPSAGAEVYLVAGDAKAESWLRMVRPGAWGPGSWVDVFVVDRGKTGPDGRYTLWSVREEGDSVQVAGGQLDFAHLALGVYAEGKGKLIEKIEVPKTGTTETNVQMDNP